MGGLAHLLSHLRPGGADGVLLPPAVASRKAGRRIRGSLLRTGAPRAVVALPLRALTVRGTAPGTRGRFRKCHDTETPRC
ncbi:hypothetical protein GUY61_07950 [Streptomyces sp. GC420]|nr:hypothetical protein [Streptomyces sp. GC420]